MSFPGNQLPSKQMAREAPAVTPRQKSETHAKPMAAPRRRTRANTDTVKLLMLGYKQELAREFTLFNSFGSSFTVLSNLTGLGGTYGIGLTYGGPVVMMWGWLVVTLFTASVGLSMAELASAYPTSGALYYWAYKLAPPRLRNLACWMTAWILTLGQAALSASVFFTFVHLLATAIEVQYGISLTSIQVFVILMSLVTVTGLLNCGTARLTAYMTTLGTMWHIVALTAFCVCVALVAPSKQPAKYIYTSWQPHKEITGITNPVYTVLVGLLMSQWSLTGYDGSAHLAEETFDAEINVPRAILLTIAGLGVTGYAFLLALTSVKVDVAALLDPGNETHGTNVVLQILIDMSKSYGSVDSGVTLFFIPIVGAFFCSYQCVANNSRMLYAFARDNGVPLAKYAKRVHPRTQAPLYGVLYMLLLTSLLATPMCFNAYVFNAVTSFAVVACYLAYALPVLCKVSTGRRFFLPGPFFLGHRLSYINNVITSLWVLTVTVLFTLPQYYPITVINMNWSAPILGVVLIFSLGWYYFPKYGAYSWFIGPRANLGQFQDVLPSEQARKAAEAAAAEAAAAVAAGNAARAAAEATDLLARVANGTAGGAASIMWDPNRGSRTSRRSAGKSLSLSQTERRTEAGAPPGDLVAMLRAASMSALASVSTRPGTRTGDMTPRGTSSFRSPPSTRRTPASAGSSRRHSALSPTSGHLSYLPNLALMLQSVGGRDVGRGVSGSGSGAGATNAASCDGRQWMSEGLAGRERVARRALARRPPRLEPWSAGGLDAERVPGYSRERLSQLARAIAGSMAGTPLPPPPVRAARASANGAEDGGGGREHFSDTGLQVRARLRRASVSVIALPAAPAAATGGPGAAGTPPRATAVAAAAIIDVPSATAVITIDP